MSFPTIPNLPYLGLCNHPKHNIESKSSMLSFHPTGVVVEIVGTTASDRGRSCEEHDCCGEVLKEDVVVRLRKVQIRVNGKEETAIAAVWVTDGCDRCCVGFLQRHMVPHADVYDRALAQVTSVLLDDKTRCNSSERAMFHKMRGCCRATIISTISSNEQVESDSDSEEDSDDNTDDDPLQTQQFTPQKRALEESP